jgi:energy-coupling factor transporter ATP-binding protein EcfA2
MRLTRLKIIRHRWCAPTELILGAKRQLVLGKNGTGKTRLLELIAKVCRAVPKELLEEPLEVEAEFVGPHSKILLTIKSTRESSGAEPGLGGRGDRAAHVSKLDLRAVIDFSGERPATYEMAGDESSCWMVTPVERLIVEVPRMRVVTINERDRFAWGGSDLGVMHWLERFLMYSRPGIDEQSRDDFWESLLFGWFHRYDEQLGTFNVLMSGTVKQTMYDDSDAGSYFTGIPGFTDDPGDEFDLTGEKPKASKAFGVLPDYLSRAGKMLGYERGGLDMREAEVIDEHPDYEVTFDSPRFYFYTGVGQTKFFEQDLSFGEKRVLSFMAYLNANPHIIIADELMNGLHHSLGVALLDEIGDRQAFLATHEPVLMDNIDFQSADELRRSLIHCERNPDPKGPPFIWSQIDETKAARIFHQYDVASIKHGHELLQDWGIW